jgi:hypothetical protein
MSADERRFAELNRVGQALDARTEELQQFLADFIPKLTAVEAGGEGQAVLVSVITKQMVTVLHHSFHAPEPRQELVKTLDDLAARLRSPSNERPN